MLYSIDCRLFVNTTSNDPFDSPGKRRVYSKQASFLTENNLMKVT